MRRDEPALGRRAGRAASVVPSATRSATPGWRDTRLWVGLLIVTVSVVVGGRLLAAADDTVEVWAAAADAGPGARLTKDDLVARRVRFGDAASLAEYLAVAEPLPEELRLVRGVGAGELVPRGAVSTDDRTDDTVELPVAVEADQVPTSVHAGSVVDVYLLGGGVVGGVARGGRGAGIEPGTPVLREATVVDAPSVDVEFGQATGRRQLVLVVPQAAAATYFAAMAATESPALTVVRRS